MPPPEGWFEYSKIGTVIPQTNIICFKVPLKQALMHDVNKEEYFQPQDVISKVEELGYSLGMVIDLTFTTKYYHKKEFVNSGITYTKIFTEGHNIPKDEVVFRFYDAVDTFKQENVDNGKVIGVHCTHGVNRTGYLVCRYMIEVLSIQPEEALSMFADARGHSIRRENYIEDLKTRKPLKDYVNQKRHLLPQTKEESFPYAKEGSWRGGSSHQLNRYDDRCPGPSQASDDSSFHRQENRRYTRSGQSNWGYSGYSGNGSHNYYGHNKYGLKSEHLSHNRHSHSASPYNSYNHNEYHRKDNYNHHNNTRRFNHRDQGYYTQSSDRHYRSSYRGNNQVAYNQDSKPWRSNAEHDDYGSFGYCH